MSKDSTKSDNIHQIREIIFGDKMQYYEKKLHEHLEKIENLQKEFEASLKDLKNKMEQKTGEQAQDFVKIEKKINQVVDNFENMLQANNKTLQQDIEELKRIKSDQTDLANIFIEIGKRLKGDNFSAQSIEREVSGENE